MTKEELLCEIGEFTWMFGMTFLVETAKGNFLWSDPDYGGDNTFTPFAGGYAEACDHCDVPYGRDKGNHYISTYCGSNIVVKTT